MDKQKAQPIQILVRKLLEARTQGVSYETLELLSVFIIYAIEQEYSVEKTLVSHKEVIKISIDELSQQAEPIRDLLLPVLTYLASNQIVVDEIIESYSTSIYYSMTEFQEGISYCLSLFEEYKAHHAKNLITPRIILELSRDIAGLADDARVLDLYARKGEWSDLLTEEMFSERLSLTDFCFEPYHFVISSLKANLSAPNNRQVSFNRTYDLTAIKQDYYDVVFANPSFANMPQESSWEPKVKVHSQFLYYAFKACKAGGKIIYVVPESFLNSGGKFDHKLRKELIKEGSLKTVIQLPNSTFSPYTKVHTAILVIEKSTDESDTAFINLAHKLKEIQEHEIRSIIELTKGNNIDSELPYSIANLNEVIVNDYDLRASRYIQRDIEKNLAPPSRLKELITQKEEELKDVRFKIAELVNSMEKSI